MRSRQGFPPCQRTTKIHLLRCRLPIPCGGAPSDQLPRRPLTSFCSVEKWHKLEASASFKFGSDRPFQGQTLLLYVNLRLRQQISTRLFSTLIQSPALSSSTIMSNQISTMKTSTIVAITVGTIVTGFLGAHSLNPKVARWYMMRMQIITFIRLADPFLQLTQFTSITREEQIPGSERH